MCQFQIKSWSPIDTSLCKSKLTNAQTNGVRPFSRLQLSLQQRTSAYGTDTSSIDIYKILLFFWSIPLDFPRISFRCLSAAIEGYGTKNSLQVFTKQETDWREQNVNDLSVLPYTRTTTFLKSWTTKMQIIPVLRPENSRNWTWQKTAVPGNFNWFLHVW